MLKKLSFFGILAASMLFFTACGGGSANTPESVAKAFLEEIADADFSGAKKYATKASASMLDMMEQAASLAPDGATETSGTVEILKSEENGDEATVYYKTEEKEEKLKVVKEDGDWKVAFSKGEMMDEGMDDAMGDGSDDIDMDFEDLGDSLGAALEELGEELKEMGEEIGEEMGDGHDHDDHEGHDH